MKRRKRKKKYLLLWIPILIFILLSGRTALSSQFVDISSMLRLCHSADTPQGWSLILVNSKNYVPNHYEFELTTLSNGKRVDSRIYPELQAMFDAARADGLQLFVREGYRTHDEQEKLLADKIQSYCNEGYSRLEAKRLALGWVAVPGTSEHELGIAVDINADTNISSSDEIYSWLESNAHNYGFIRRYHPNKSDITGVNYEPWHYRYVGVDAATRIHDRGWCLEEFIEHF